MQRVWDALKGLPCERALGADKDGRNSILMWGRCDERVKNCHQQHVVVEEEAHKFPLKPEAHRDRYFWLEL